MMDRTFDIDTNEIDLEKLIDTIKQNIDERKKQGAYTAKDVDLIERHDPCQRQPSGKLVDTTPLSNTMNIENTTYRISSHRKLAGMLLVKGRSLIHGEVKRYTDPVFSKQKEFNVNVISAFNSLVSGIEARLSDLKIEILNENDKSIEALTSRISRMESNASDIAALKFDLEALRRDTAELKLMVSSIRDQADSIVDARLNDYLSKIDSRTEEMSVELSGMIDHRLAIISGAIGWDDGKRALFSSAITDQCATSASAHSAMTKMAGTGIDYFMFNDEMSKAWTRIGGIVPDAPNIVDDSINIFAGCGRVLDLGCGRGYFMERLTLSGIDVYGIDINDAFIDHCKNKGLDVVKVDAIGHLRSIKDGSLGGIFSSHLVEHLNYDTIKELLTLCYKKLQPGGYLVILTPNILNIMVSSNLFYMDPTHISHIHPEVLKFLLRSCGFVEVEDRFYQPVPDSMKLKKVEITEAMTAELRSHFERFNNNVDILNNILFSNRDYAVICKR